MFLSNVVLSSVYGNVYSCYLLSLKIVLRNFYMKSFVIQEVL